MAWGTLDQRFDVVIDDRTLGFVAPLATGQWVAMVSGDRKVGTFETPIAARAAVLDWHAARTRRADAWRQGHRF